jgi:hypothetical protein
MRDQSELHRPTDAPNVYAALAELARSAPDGALATAATVGLLAVAGLLFAPWGGRALLLPLVAVGAFGLWGIVERDRGSPAPTDSATRIGTPVATAVQWLAVALGTAAAVLAALVLLGELFGTVIS